MREMVAGTAVDRGDAIGQGAGTLPITATSIITVTATTETAIVTIGAIDRTEATELDEFTHLTGFISEPIGDGEDQVQGSEVPKSGVLDTPEPHSHNGQRHSLADVAELADAQVSEACDGDIVEVQVLSSAPKNSANPSIGFAVLIYSQNPLPAGNKKSCHGIYQSGVLVIRGQSERGVLMMNLDQALIMESDNLRPSTNQSAMVHLKLAERPDRDRIQRVVDLADALLNEAETLARDKAFTEEANKLRPLDIIGGIDFYDEVQRFETHLIKMALSETGGNQAKAARLLGIKATTLNSKIKLFNIQAS